jgi:hypothetical protein
VSETNRKALADSTPGAGDQDSCILRGTQIGILHREQHCGGGRAVFDHATDP